MGGIPKSWACEFEFMLQGRVEAYLINIQSCTTAFLNCLTCNLLTQCHQSHGYHFLQQSELTHIVRKWISNNLQDPPAKQKVKGPKN